MTPEVLEQGSTQKRAKGESLEAFLKRASHMSIVGKGVEIMENLNMCKNLSVLYLYDNKISKIAGLELCKNLSRLYLQNNQIETIEGLDCGLDRLTDLHLSGNKLTLITGLHALPSLETLHVDHQKTSQPLEFDVASMEALGNSLKHLTATSNRIKDLTPLTALGKIQDIDLSNNDISEWEQEVKNVLVCCEEMVNLNINANPVNHTVLKLRQRAILASKSLECFNEKDIPNVERDFLYNMEMARKRNQRTGASQAASGGVPFTRQDSMNGPGTLTTMPSFNSLDRKVLNNLGVKVSFNGMEENRPIPHLPPYASQYSVSKALDQRRAALRSGMRRAQVARAAEISLMPLEQRPIEDLQAVFAAQFMAAHGALTVGMSGGGGGGMVTAVGGASGPRPLSPKSSELGLMGSTRSMHDFFSTASESNTIAEF
ncbi:hypothetical protein HDU97_007329 [Phlyctochytrium planicorne]|nr:hypothetical protein HDU97_007329 [Phlyctochytrium planicorne]